MPERRSDDGPSESMILSAATSSLRRGGKGSIRDTPNYGRGNAYGDVRFRSKYFKAPAPRVFRNRVCKGKTHTCVDQTRTYLDFVLHLQLRKAGSSASHLAIPEDNAVTATPRKACKDWFSVVESKWLGEGTRKTTALV